jgi:hypothetical protein
MTPRPTVDVMCPNCGMLNCAWDLPKPYERTYCVECGADLHPAPPPPDALHVSGAKTLEEGAAAIRERVAEIRRRRDG